MEIRLFEPPRKISLENSLFEKSSKVLSLRLAKNRFIMRIGSYSSFLCTFTDRAAAETDKPGKKKKRKIKNKISILYYGLNKLVDYEFIYKGSFQSVDKLMRFHDSISVNARAKGKHVFTFLRLLL